MVKFSNKSNPILNKQKKYVERWYKNFVDRSYRGPRPRRDKTVEKNGWFSIGGCCPSGGGEDDRTGLLSSTSFRLRNLPRTGPAQTMM
jgi:hypothetical protein